MTRVHRPVGTREDRGPRLLPRHVVAGTGTGTRTGSDRHQVRGGVARRRRLVRAALGPRRELRRGLVLARSGEPPGIRPRKLVPTDVPGRPHTWAGSDRSGDRRRRPGGRRPGPGPRRTRSLVGGASTGTRPVVAAGCDGSAPRLGPRPRRGRPTGIAMVRTPDVTAGSGWRNTTAPRRSAPGRKTGRTTFRARTASCSPSTTSRTPLPACALTTPNSSARAPGSRTAIYSATSAAGGHHRRTGRATALRRRNEPLSGRNAERRQPTALCCRGGPGTGEALQATPAGPACPSPGLAPARLRAAYRVRDRIPGRRTSVPSPSSHPAREAKREKTAREYAAPPAVPSLP